MNDKPCVRNSTLQCNLEAIRAIADGELQMEFPADNCCDMRGAIKLATAVMPSCWRIVTMQGGHPDTVYSFFRDRWAAAEFGDTDANVVDER